jgi:hypothetical protein
VKKRGIASLDFFVPVGLSFETGEEAVMRESVGFRSFMVAEREERRSGRLGRGEVSIGEMPYWFGLCSPLYRIILLLATTVSSDRG